MALIDDALISLARTRTILNTEHLFAADWFDTLGRLIEERDEFEHRHNVTHDQIIDLVVDVAVTESAAETRARKQRALYATETRRAVNCLLARGLPIEFIARVFGLSRSAIATYAQQRRITPHEAEILVLHRQGRSTSQISHELYGVTAHLADQVVRRNGGTPNVVTGLSDAKTDQAIAIYEAGKHTWPEACAELEITRGQYRNVLRGARLIA